MAVVILSAIPGIASAASAPPVDMFQLPWEQGKAWVSYDGLDNGLKRSSTSPHNYKNGGAIDFAPRVKMTVGEDTSNDWVVAAAAGTVYQVGSCYIKIEHGNGWITEYWHLDNIQVTAGSTVSRNQRIGIIHNNANAQVCPGNEYPGPHLHFVFRPNVLDTRFAGWTVNYNIFTNKTTYTKNGQTLPILTPLMNIPDLQTVMRGILDWDRTYLGSVDPYRNERWSLLLVEDAQFDIFVSPSSIGLVPVIVLLDENGNEITRANGTLSSTQPAGFYYVEIRSEAGTGYYEIVATKSTSNGATVTPTFTATLPPTGTPIPSETVTPEIATPTPTGIINATESPTPTVTVTPSPTESLTSTATATADLTSTAIAATQTAMYETSVAATQTAITGTFVAETQTAFAGTQTAIVETSIAGTQTALALTPTAIPTPLGPYVLVDVIQSPLALGQTSLVNVSLNNVPLDGYSAVEFICAFDPTILEVNSIQAAELFGAEPASALNGPENGQFIFAIAGSNGRKDTSSGTAFTFAVRGLQVGESAVQCTARVSTGAGALQSIEYIPDIVTIIDSSITPTATQPTMAFVTGQVLASKPVTIQLYDAGNVLVVSQAANLDGTFNIPVGGGSYTISASAEGYLNAQGFISLTNGTVTTMQTVTLPAGDIDGNSVIDQFDALTIGMNYNASIPAVADLNNDGVINILDLELLAANYRKSGALAWQ